MQVAQNYRTLAPFLLVGVITLQEERKKERKKKKEERSLPLKKWPLKLSSNTFTKTNARASIAGKQSIDTN